MKKDIIESINARLKNSIEFKLSTENDGEVTMPDPSGMGAATFALSDSDKDDVKQAEKFMTASLFETKAQFSSGKLVAKAILGKEIGEGIGSVLYSAYYGLLLKDLYELEEGLSVIASAFNVSEAVDHVTAFNADNDDIVKLALECNARTYGAVVLAKNDPRIKVKGTVTALDVFNAFKLKTEQVLRCNKHRGVYTPRVPTVSTSIYAMDGKWEEKKEATPNEDGTPRLTHSFKDVTLPLGRMVKTVTQTDNKIFDLIRKDLRANGHDPDEITLPLTINVQMCIDVKIKKALTKELKDAEDCNNEEKLKRLSEVLDAISTTDGQLKYECDMVKSILHNGFWYEGVHYAYLLSTQSQIRAGAGTFMIDPDNKGELAMAKLLHDITGGDDVNTVLNGRNGTNKELADMLLRNMQDRISKFRSGKSYDINLSKAMGRFGLTASTSVNIRAVFESNDSPIFKFYEDILKNARILVVKDADVTVKTDAKTVSFSKLDKPRKSGQTHKGKLKLEKDVELIETISDGGGLFDIAVMAAVSLATHHITESDAEFFKKHWIDENKYRYDFTFLKAKASAKDKTAKRLQKIILKIISCAQCRIPGGDTEGFGGKGAFTKASIKHDAKLKAIGKDGYDVIMPESCIKFFKDGTDICLLNLRVCNTSKPHDLERDIAKMSAQYMGGLNLNADEVAQIGNTCIDNIVGALNVKGKTIEETIDSFIALNIVGAKRDINAFNQARELVKANPKMRFDKRFMTHLRSWASSQLCDIAKGSIPVHGAYLLQVCDPYDCLNRWFEKEFEAKGVKKYKTLKDCAEEAGISDHIFYVNGFNGRIAIFRSPANTRYELQNGNAVAADILWWLNNVIVYNCAEAIWRLLGGSDFDGDKVLVLLDIDDVNGIIIRSVPMNPEIKIVPKDIGETIGAQGKKTSMTVDNIVKLISEISKKSKIGQIAKWASAQLSVASHIKNARNLAFDNNCGSIEFVVPCLKGHGWVDLLGNNYKFADELHKKMVDFMSKNHEQGDFTRTIEQNNFSGFVVKDYTLYVEGYVEMRKDEVGNLVAKTWTDKNGEEHYCGLIGNYGLDQAFNKMQYYLSLNEINAVAGGIEIDATNNGFSSFFHEKAGFMGAHELFRDIMKGKEINNVMAASTYYNIGTLGGLFAVTMQRWNDVMGLITHEDEVDMTDYMCSLLPRNQLDAIMAKSKALAGIRADYADKMNDIMAEYDEDDDERIIAIRDLERDTRSTLITLSAKGKYQMDLKTLALACYLMGNGQSFSFLFVESLRNLLEDDPTATGIVKMPKSYDPDKMEAIVEDINGHKWIVIKSSTQEELYRSVNIADDKLYERTDADGDNYVWYHRSATNPVAPNQRRFDLSEANIANLQKKAVVNIVPNQPLTDLKSICNTGVDGLVAINIYMEGNGETKVNLVDLNTGALTPFGKKIDILMNGVPDFTKSIIKACVVNHIVILDVSNAKLSKDGVSINGATVYNANK